MAGIAYVYKRLWNPDLVIDANGVLPRGARQAINGKNRPTYHIKWHGTTQADEELGTAPTSAKDGTTTPFQLTVVSSDVGDNRSTAAGYVHSVAVIGISTNSIAGYNQWLLDSTTTEGWAGRPQSTVEVFAMNGTTDVLSTRYYLWVDHVYACEWGTGATHDAEGNITVESPANTTLLTLAATYNEGEGGRWHFKEGAEVRTDLIRIANTATLAAGDGVSVLGTFTGFDKQLNDSNIIDKVDTYSYIHYGGEKVFDKSEELFSRYATRASTCIWTEKLIANAKAIDIEIVQSTNRSPTRP
jgi:hypothetical protein